ncbi:MAG: ABC transporter permease [Pyrinomonadaceae bacterium]
MRKYVAVLKHEYKKIVLKWTFLIGTLLFPVIGMCFAIVPAIIFSLKGEQMRIVVVDPANKILPRLKQNLSAERITEKAREAGLEQIGDVNASQEDRMKRGAEQLASGFAFLEYPTAGKSIDQIRGELNARAASDEIDAYLLVPGELEGGNAKFEFRSRKAGDFVASDTLQDAVNEAVRSQRLADAHIDEGLLRNLSQNVAFEAKSISESGEEKDSDTLFIASLAIGMMIYITLTIYGQVIMGAVVEEKETRIAEILFSSATPFQLMFGKLVGVGLAGLTQLAIWVGSLAALIGILTIQGGDMASLTATLPNITPLMLLYFFIYFIVGYFIYASIFALIGSMVTTVQEGGQFAFPPIMIMLIGFYFSFAVIRDPNSSLSFWVSIAPLFAPLTMPVRILAEMPPFWQIGLSILLNCLAIAGLVWLAGRVYRVGMLMYGKRATIPEVLKWIRQS